MRLFYDEDRSEIKLPSGVTPLEVDVSSIEKQRVIAELEGRNGKINEGFVFRDRDILIRLLLRAEDKSDFPLLRDEVYEFFHLGDRVYVSDPHQEGKLYSVTIDTKYMPEKLNTHTAIMDIECTTTELPFAESIGTTADLDKHGLRYSDELWSYGMGLSYDEETHKYTHNTNTFRIYNAGNVEVHPFEMDLKIAIDGINGPYELKNETTGGTFKYTGSNSGKLLLDGPNITLNGLQAFRDTNRWYITLAPGWNTFTQSKNKKVAFDFRYYYK